ncbi:hypothetical protein Tco_0588665 [Tanacetum coccineum]
MIPKIKRLKEYRDYKVFSMELVALLEKWRHRYAVSSLMDTAYWMLRLIRLSSYKLILLLNNYVDGMDSFSWRKVRLLFGLYNITGGNCSRLNLLVIQGSNFTFGSNSFNGRKDGTSEVTGIGLFTTNNTKESCKFASRLLWGQTQISTAACLHICVAKEWLLCAARLEKILYCLDLMHAYACFGLITSQGCLPRQRERKAKSILLLAIPDKYQLRFHTIKDAKTLWAAIKSLDKAYDRFQKLISLLEVHGAAVSNEDANQKFLRALPSSWNNVALIIRNKAGIDDLDIDDLYNNLKVFEADIKGSSESSLNSQNVAFLSTEDTSSSNEINTANGVSTGIRP